MVPSVLDLPFTHFGARVSSDPSSGKDLKALEAAPEDFDTWHTVVLAC
jgi:hypothetical protein